MPAAPTDPPEAQEQAPHDVKPQRKPEKNIAEHTAAADGAPKRKGKPKHVHGRKAALVTATTPGAPPVSAPPPAEPVAGPDDKAEHGRGREKHAEVEPSAGDAPVRAAQPKAKKQGRARKRDT